MILDELVTKFGIDVDIEKIKAFVGAIGNAAKTIADKANQANAALKRVNDNAIAGAQQIGEQAQAAEKPLNRMKLIALGVGTLITGLAAKATGFVVGAIAGARDLAKEKGLLYKITERELAQADAYTAATHKNQLAIESLRTKIALNLMPAFTQMQEGLYSILLTNKDLITNGMTKLIQFVGKFGQVMHNGWRAIDLAVSGTIGWKNALLVLAVVLGIVKRETIKAFIANPVMWVVAAITGLLLLLDDLMVYLNGGDAQFGEFWGECIKWIKIVKAWWISLSDDWKGTLTVMAGMIATAFSVHGLKGFISSAKVLTAVMKPLASTIGMVSKAFTFMRAAILANPMGWVIALIGALIYIGYDLYKWLHGGKSTFGAWYQWVEYAINGVKAWFNDLFKNIFRWFGASEKDAQRYTDKLGNIFSKVVDLLLWPFAAAFNFIKGAYNAFTDDSTTWVQKFEAIFGLLLDYLSTPFKAGWELVKAIFGLADGDVGKFITTIGKSFSSVIDAIVKPFKAAFDEVKRYYDDTVGRIPGAWDSVKEGALKAWHSTLEVAGLSDSTSTPQPANYASQNNSHATTVKGGDVKAEIHISATNTDDARRGVETGLDNANKRAMARLQGVAKG